MKYFPIIAVLALALAGCSKQDSSSSTPDDAKKATAPTADTIKQTVDTAKAAGEKAVAEAGSKAQELIDKAKSLVTDNKFQDASTVLQQLGGMNLSDAQQKLVDDLKAQIQKALVNKATGDASSAVGNILGGKK
jgi:hypothetical protein